MALAFTYLKKFNCNKRLDLKKAMVRRISILLLRRSKKTVKVQDAVAYVRL